MQTVKNIQLGKKSLTDNFIGTLKDHFKKHQNVKISILKSLTRDKKELREISERILDSLGKNYTSKIIGYTIILKKWRKAIR